MRGVGGRGDASDEAQEHEGLSVVTRWAAGPTGRVGNSRSGRRRLSQGIKFPAVEVV